jgi:hypothetical protein
MVTAALLRAAARRWPEHLRADLLREWGAEAHVLASEGRRWAMLRYAGSLALARPAREPVPLAQHARNAWPALRLALFGPLLAAVLFCASVIAGFQVAGYLPQSLRSELIITALCLLSAVPLILLGQRWSLPDRPLAALAAVTVPGLTLCLLIYDLFGDAFDQNGQLGRHGPANVLYFAGLALLLAWTGSRSRSGRRRSARWLTITGALILADLATTVTVTRVDITQHLSATSLLWWPVAQSGRNHGMAGLYGYAMPDHVLSDTWLYIVFTAFALGAALGRRRTAPAAPAALPEQPGEISAS